MPSGHAQHAVLLRTLLLQRRPLFVKGHRPGQDLLIGAVSWGPGKCINQANFDTNVAQLRPWVDETTQKLVPWAPLDAAREWRRWGRGRQG